MRSLAPEHLEDLQRSGLNETTIAKAGLYSVCPSELRRFPSVQSGLAFPYPGLDGKMNDFCRIKLFPPAQDKDGHTIRYLQPRATDPHIYFPLLHDWLAIGIDPTRPIAGTEGEKKALAISQICIPCLGLGGLWSFLSKADGIKNVLPVLELIRWQGRPFEFAPDSDVWNREDLLRPVALFGLLLVQRGAQVQLVKIPDHRGVKQGIDDFLAREAAWPKEAWRSLERFGLDDGRLKNAMAWARRWLDKQTVNEALRAQDQESLDIMEGAGLFTVRSAKHGVTFTLERLEDRHGGIYAELTVTLGTTVIREGISLNLKSDHAQGRQAASLKAYSSTIPWRVLLPKVCGLVLRRYRRGEPLVVLHKDVSTEPLMYAVNPLVFLKKISILFATGGMAKSTLGLFLAMLICLGASASAFRTIRGKVLYLDYEDDGDVHARRLRAIQAGHPELQGASILYQRAVEPLWKLSPVLVRQIQEQDITFIVVDSLLAATGGDSSAEATTKLFIALRTLNVSALLIGHTPKTQADGQEHATVYGSVFNGNFSRSVWEVQKEQEVGDDGMVLGLFHRKSNLSRLHPPIGLKLTQNEDGTLIRFEEFDLSQADELEKSLPVASRIRNFLEQDGGVYTAKEIAESTDIKLSVVKFTLSKHRGRKWQMIGENRDAKWTVLNR